LSKEELIKNLNAAAGTNTPLGSIIKSPNLQHMFENLTANFPFAGGDKITGDIANQVTRKAEDLLEASGKGATYAEPREQIQSAIQGAFDKQTEIKNTMYKPVNELSFS
jgi:16S rRNA G1207 methylase RsmC